MAQAQEANPQGERPVAQADAPTPLEATAAEPAQSVTVTARKRVEKVQDAPVVITTWSADRIDRLELRSIEELSNVTPGLIVTRGNSGSGADFRLRGVGSTFTSIGIEQSLAVIVDGAYFGQGRVIDEAFDDVQRIELLKGPQALFFGKNSTAGVLSITSGDPGKAFELKARAGYEWRSRERKGLFVISGPVSDTMGLRFALSGRDMDDGYVRNDAPATTYTTRDAITGVSTPHVVPPPSDRDLPGNRSLFGRLTATYTPSNALKLTLKATAGTQRTGSYAANVRPWRCVTGASSINPSQPCGDDFAVQQNPLPPEIAAMRADSNRYGGQPYTRYNARTATARVDYAANNFLLTSITNGQYYRFGATADYDFTGVPAIYGDENDNYRAFSEELRAQTQWIGPLNYMVGFFYQRTRLRFNRASLIGGSEDTSVDPANRYVTISKFSTTRGETRSVFGQVLWTPWPQVEAAAGARYTDETKRSFFVQPYVNRLAAGLFPANTPLNIDQHFNDWSPEASLKWKPRENLMAYGAWKQGYKSGGFSNSGTLATGGSIDVFTFRPETVKGVEAGLKTTLLDNRLLLNLAAYHYRYSDLQLEFFNAPTLTLVTTNIGSATIKGLEAEAEYLPPAIRGLRLRGSVQHNLARYRNFIGPCYAGQTAAQGCNQPGPPPTNATLQDLSGKPLAGAPKWTGTLGFDLDRSLTNSWGLGVSTNVRYSSRYSASPVAQPLAVQPSYTWLDASIRVQSPDRRTQVALIGKNLTNRFVVSYASDSPNTPPRGSPAGTLADQAGIFLPPRTVELQLTWRY